MALRSLKDPFVSIGGVDFSDNVSLVMIHEEETSVTESIVAGQEWAHNTPSKKGRWNAQITFEFDGYAAAQFESKMVALLPEPLGVSSNPDSQPLIVRPSAGAVSADNPQYTGDIVLSGFDPFGAGQVGNQITFNATFPGDGSLTRTTS